MPNRKKTTRRKINKSSSRRTTRRPRTRINTRRHRGGMGFQEPKNGVTVTMNGITMTENEYKKHMEGLGSSTDSGL
jgi:hypothetical protein